MGLTLIHVSKRGPWPQWNTTKCPFNAKAFLESILIYYCRSWLNFSVYGENTPNLAKFFHHFFFSNVSSKHCNVDVLQLHLVDTLSSRSVRISKLFLKGHTEFLLPQMSTVTDSSTQICPAEQLVNKVPTSHLAVHNYFIKFYLKVMIGGHFITSELCFGCYRNSRYNAKFVSWLTFQGTIKMPSSEC